MKKTIVAAAMLLASSHGFSQEVDKLTGLIVAPGFESVRANCMACHSMKLVTQNRMTRDTWLETIRWMQETQGLWPLKDQEKAILDYLGTHYAPVDSGRRKALPVHLMPKP